MKKKGDKYESDNNEFFKQFFPQIVHRASDQCRAIIDSDNFDTLWQPCL